MSFEALNDPPEALVEKPPAQFNVEPEIDAALACKLRLSGNVVKVVLVDDGRASA